jgi:hypothetical protein
MRAACTSSGDFTNRAGVSVVIRLKIAAAMSATHMARSANPCGFTSFMLEKVRQLKRQRNDRYPPKADIAVSQKPGSRPSPG